MLIKNLPILSRPREKLIYYGTNKVSNEELVAILFQSGMKGRNALDLGKLVLKQFSSDQLGKVTLKELTNIAGIGSSKAAILLAALEFGKRLFQNKKSALILSAEDVWRELKDIRFKKKEYFVIFYLDSRNQEIAKEIISIGSVNASMVHPREVFEPAVRNCAYQIIVAHNHPSNDCTPSDADILVTQRLIEAGKLLGIDLIDHVIVTKDSFFSCREKRLIK